MKKIFAFIALCALTQYLYACDICGCGGGNFYMGLLPNFKTKFIGIRYQYMNYHTQLTNDASQFSTNYYNTIDVWSGWNIGKKWQLLTFIPFHINKQIDDDGITNTNGIGDITLLANYSILHKTQRYDITKSNEQQLFIGSGIKLPTGKFNADVLDPNITVADVNAQLGTGSTDFILNTMYNLRFNKLGINTTANYKINTDKNTYKFGNRLMASSYLYYKLGNRATTFAPNVGIIYENTSRNTLAGEKVASTGGYITTAATGIEINLTKIAVGCSFSAPIGQNYADGQTKLKFRASTHISFDL